MLCLSTICALKNENRINKSTKRPLSSNLIENKESKADVIYEWDPGLTGQRLRGSCTDSVM